MPVGDDFHEPRLGFRVRKPAAWRFLPPAWSPVQQLRNALAAEDLDHWMHHASQPFCCAMGHHDSASHVYPTLQATARPGRPPDAAQAAALLSSLCDEFVGRHGDCRIDWARHDVEIAGCRALDAGVRYRLMARSGDGARVEQDFGVVARSWMIFATGRTFVVGLSGSDDPEYHDEADVTTILASLRIDRP